MAPIYPADSTLPNHPDLTPMSSTEADGGWEVHLTRNGYIKTDISHQLGMTEHPVQIPIFVSLMYEDR